MSPVLVGFLVFAGLLYLALVVLEFQERADMARLEERRRRLTSQAVFNRRLNELRARADEDELEDGCQGGHPAPQPIGLQIVGPNDAAIAEELIRQTSHLPRRSEA